MLRLISTVTLASPTTDTIPRSKTTEAKPIYLKATGFTSIQSGTFGRTKTGSGKYSNSPDNQIPEGSGLTVRIVPRHPLLTEGRAIRLGEVLPSSELPPHTTSPSPLERTIGKSPR